MPLAIVAVGGNALTQATQVGTIAEQYENAAITCNGIARLLGAGWQVVVTHGNGPQVGNALRRVEIAKDQVYPLPLDICVADTQGGIGYMLQQVLTTVLASQGQSHSVATIITQVLVDANDPAFQQPSKPIGPFLSAEQADERRAQGWILKEDSGRGFRRVVPSPLPKTILELDAIRALLSAGITPIAAGGGGVPVVQRSDGLHGIAAVIDKDLASSLLATALHADLLVVATGVPHVFVDFGTDKARPLHQVSAKELDGYAKAGQFPAGSMGPKIRAVQSFMAQGGARAAITDLDHLLEAALGQGGTQIVP